MIPNNINIHDVYAAAATGVPVTPGLGFGYGYYGGQYGAYPPHYDSYQGRHKNRANIPSTIIKVSLAILGVGATATLLGLAARGNKLKVPGTGLFARFKAARLGMPDAPPGAFSSLEMHGPPSVATPKPGIFARIGKALLGPK